MRQRLSSLLLLLTAAAYCSAAPQLELVHILGDTRGKSVNNLSVAVTEDGTIYLLMKSGRVAVFDADGTYRQSRRLALEWPQNRYYLQAGNGHVFLGNAEADLAWATDPARHGSEPGRFRSPSAGELHEGNWFIADTGNDRVQIFAAEATDKPRAVIELPAAPRALDVRGAELAVLTDGNKVRVYRDPVGDPELVASGGTIPGGVSVAIAPDGVLLTASSNSLAQHCRKAGSVGKPDVIAPPWHKAWPDVYPDAAPIAGGASQQAWYLDRSRGKVLAYDPETKHSAARVTGIRHPSSLAFDKKGNLFVGTRHAKVFRCDPAQETPDPEPLFGGDPLYGNSRVPIWGLLPAPDGSLYVRLIEKGWRKGWPAFTLHKLAPDGTSTRVIEFGPLYARRSRFAPAALHNAIIFDRKGRLILALAPMKAVYALTPEGDIVWEASPFPAGGADKVEFLHVRDLAVDSRGRIWAVDSDAHAVFCLYDDGRLLLRHGQFGGVDDRSGRGFDSPAGIACIQHKGNDHLVVGDAGNQRLVEFRIKD